MPAMTDTLLSEMIEAWFAEHPVEPYIKREDEPEFFKRVERVYRAVERRMTPSAKASMCRKEWVRLPTCGCREGECHAAESRSKGD